MPRPHRWKSACSTGTSLRKDVICSDKPAEAILQLQLGRDNPSRCRIRGRKSCWVYLSHNDRHCSLISGTLLQCSPTPNLCRFLPLFPSVQQRHTAVSLRSLLALAPIYALVMYPLQWGKWVAGWRGCKMNQLKVTDNRWQQAKLRGRVTRDVQERGNQLRPHEPNNWGWTEALLIFLNTLAKFFFLKENNKQTYSSMCFGFFPHANNAPKCVFF